MPTEPWPSLSRGSKKWYHELERVSREASSAVDAGRDPSVYLRRLEELTGHPVDPVRYQASLGPKKGRALRDRLRRGLSRVVLVLMTLVLLPPVLMWPVVFGLITLFRKLKLVRDGRPLYPAWQPARIAVRVLALLLMPHRHTKLRGLIVAAMLENDPSSGELSASS